MFQCLIRDSNKYIFLISSCEHFWYTQVLYETNFVIRIIYKKESYCHFRKKTNCDSKLLS
jgi:hypothetical protein